MGKSKHLNPDFAIRVPDEFDEDSDYQRLASAFIEAGIENHAIGHDPEDILSALLVAHAHLFWAWGSPPEAVQAVLRGFADQLPQLFAALDLRSAKPEGSA